MKKIHDFDSWLTEGKRGMTKKQIEFLDECTDGVWTYNEGSGLVDITGDFYCEEKGLKTLQGVRFGRVSGYFNCDDNQLTSLVGAPQVVGGGFSCTLNQLTSLEGAPQIVGRNFWCNANQLTSLEGAPQKVGGRFFCSANQLTTLEGAPREVGGDFCCNANQLTTLEGAPQEVGGDFDCSNNELASLEGAPEKIGGEIRIEGVYSKTAIKMEGKDWNLQGWLRIYREGNEETKALVSTLPAFQEIMKEHPEEFEDLSDLMDLGF